MRIRTISDKKQSLIDKENNKPREIGDVVIIKEGCKPNLYKKERAENLISVEIMELGEKIKVIDRQEHQGSPFEVSTSDIVRVQDWNIGENPFEGDDHLSIRFVAFCLDSILFALNITGEKRRDKEGYKNKKGYLISELNWMPYVYNSNGEKEYYQRDFVWTLEENQLLIESIYQSIECGRILVRKRSWEEIDKMVEDAAFHDIVDGKQRLNAIRGFIASEFPDMEGRYFGDLSAYAQYRFTNHQLFTYAEMQENTADKKVLEQFLKLNFAGMPQSKEHIAHVKSLYQKLT